MSKEAFTPGPWRANSHREVKVANGNSMICRAHLHEPRRGEAECKANAHLIAASPDMYEALKGLTTAFQARIDSTGGTNTELRELAAAREALSKARGEAQ